MITKREITEALALSCVESYFLAWLAKRFDVSKLYGESFVPIGQVFDDFAQGAKYEAYEGVPRIQETAEKAGIAAHVYSVFPMGVPGSREKLAECLKNQREEDLCLMHVNEAFFAEYKRKPGGRIIISAWTALFAGSINIPSPKGGLRKKG